MYNKKKEVLVDALDKAGLAPVKPEGSYFVVGNTSGVDAKKYVRSDVKGTPDQPQYKDYQFCRWLTKEVGVAAIPVRYDNTNT